MPKSSDDIKQDLIDKIQASVPNADTKLGSFLRDTIIDPSSRSLAEAYALVQDAALAQSPVTASNENLVTLAAVFQIYRKGAIKATGTVRFYRSTEPQQDVTITAGTTVSTNATAESAAAAFRTTQTVTLPGGSAAAAYLNADTGKYEISSSIEALQGGLKGNKAAHTITVMVDAVTGIEGVYNASASSGGADRETFNSLRSRLLASIQGNNVGTKAGYVNLVRQNENVEESIVLTPVDANAIRPEAGAVDILIKGTQSIDSTETYNPAVSGNYPSYVFLRQPWVYSAATGSVSVISSVSGSLDQGTHFQVWKDTGSYGGSERGFDQVQWLVDVNSSGYGALEITYSYNSLVGILQDTMDLEDNHAIGGDVLIKDAVPVGIDVTMTIIIATGYDPTSTATLVSTATANFINTLPIGEDVSQANLVADVLAVIGVDDVHIPFTTFQSSDGSITQDANNNLVIPSLYRAVAGTITINTI